MKHSLKITKLVAVEDTRELVEDGDRWVRLPGTGLERSCGRCGRAHEVHATVELEDGSSAVVGTGCMTASDLVAAATVRSELRRAARMLELGRRIERLERDLERARELGALVAALPLPEIVAGELVLDSGKRIPTLSMGGVELWCTFGDRSSELELAWRTEELALRLREAGNLSQAYRAADLLAQARKALERLKPSSASSR